MQETCHRCGGDLAEGRSESPFCPHCGAPQLFLALENQSVETGGEAGGAASTGVAAPPRTQQVEWKTAIRCAAAVAGVGSVLTLVAMPDWRMAPLLSSLKLLWIMSASLITLGFYQKRRPAAWVDVRVGARIGVVVGICLAVELGVAMAGAGLVGRFVLHSMASFDAQTTEQIQTVLKTMQQQSTPVPADALRFIRSPEFRAGIMLASFAMASAGLLVVSALGGAFAGLLRKRREPAV
jgi:hypothetical protein